MKLTATAIRLMAEKGLSATDIADVVEAMEKGADSSRHEPSPGAIRQRRYRDRLAAASLNSEDWGLVARRIIARDGGRCQYCHTTLGRMCCDHIKPLIHGGDNSDENLVAACEVCNGGKSGKSLEQWKGAVWAAEWQKNRAASRTRHLLKEQEAPIIVSSRGKHGKNMEEESRPKSWPASTARSWRAGTA